jgi:hypothetical protein
MSVLESLRTESQDRNAGAVTPEADTEANTDAFPAAGSTSDAEAKTDPAGSTSDAEAKTDDPLNSYCTYWIEQLKNLDGLSSDAAVATIHQALRNAPVDCCPRREDAQMFILAGNELLSRQKVIAWLTLRPALENAEGIVDPKVAAYWRRKLDPSNALSADAWSAHCRQVEKDARNANRALSSDSVHLLSTHPALAHDYLECGGLKARLCSVNAQTPSLREGVNPLSNPPGAIPPIGAFETASLTPAPEQKPQQKQPSDSTPTASVESPGFPQTALMPPAHGMAAGQAPGASMGQTLGDLVGGLTGGLVGGLKSSFSRALSSLTDVRTPAPDPLARSVCGAAESAPAEFGNCEPDPQARSARGAAESALAEFARSARGLEQHPHLSTFWREVGAQADTRFGGDRTAVLDAMAADPGHSLQAMFNHQTRVNPDVSLRYEEAHAAFERLQTAWNRCMKAHQNIGKVWAPSFEQSQTLRTACRWVPPGPDRPSLVQETERLLRTLAQTVRQAFDRLRTAAHSSSTAPAS